MGTTQQWERKINNPKFSTPLSLFGFPLCLVFPKPQGRSVWVAPRRAGWTDRRSPPPRTPGPGPSLGTGPGKPAGSKPLQSSRERASERASEPEWRPTHRDARDVLLALVGHGGGGGGCSSCLPPSSFCSCSPASSSAHSAPRSGGANGALAAAAASSRLRPPPRLPRRLPETIVNLPGPPFTPDLPPAPQTHTHTHSPHSRSHPGFFFFFFCGTSWDPVKQEWLIRDSSLFSLIPIDFPLCICLTHFFFFFLFFLLVTCECSRVSLLHRHQGARGTVRGGDTAVPRVGREAPASPSRPRGPSPRLRPDSDPISHLPHPRFRKKTVPGFSSSTRSPPPPCGLNASAAAFVTAEAGRRLCWSPSV